MPEYFEKLVQLAQSALTQIHVRSALNPLIWFLCYTISGCLGALVIAKDPIVQITMLIFLGFMICSGVAGFAYFAITKPDYLRSESYHIQKQSIETMGTKAEQLDTKAEHLVAIASPGTRSDNDG